MKSILKVVILHPTLTKVNRNQVGEIFTEFKKGLNLRKAVRQELNNQEYELVNKILPTYNLYIVHVCN